MGPVAASPSEGEINSGDEEKATKPSTHSARHGVVNNSIRLPSGASSRAPQTDTAQDAMAISPYREGRSRSPYRAKRRSPSYSRSRSGSLSRSPSPPSRRGLNDRLRSRSPSPHRGGVAKTGDKRPRGVDHYAAKANSDPRRFKVHYEDQSADRKSTLPAPRTSGPSSRPPTGPRAPADRAVQHGRARSRSPYRKPATTSINDRGGRSDKESTSAAPLISAPLIKSNGFTESSSKDKPASTTGSDRARGPEGGADGLAVDFIPEPKLSEDELIEQRRKKREAIKAKYKTQQTPLLVQALEQSAISAPSTPHHDSSGPPSVQASPPASIDSPRTPHSPGSPAEFAVADDEELANRKHGDSSGDEEEGPSAADYDPNMDMQEDRPDHKVQPSKLSDVQVPVTAIQQETRATAPASKKEFDMFADDEDEDMFAETTTAPKATAVGEARTLDQNLLDNWDYPDGHYRIILGEILDGRYVVQQQIGKGTFATVVRAKDTKTDKDVAVKIACNNETMYKAGTKEMEMLSMLNAADTEDKKHIIRLHRNFDHKGHLCLVFENLSADLREVLK
ncbi:U4/U6 small nuclear ribonucleoprotein prp4, partial [Oleoguttula sp. CCFEE 5521]